jgi:hypothetical protein
VEVLTESFTSFKRQVFRRDHDLPLTMDDNQIDQEMKNEETQIQAMRQRGLSVEVDSNGNIRDPLTKRVLGKMQPIGRPKQKKT